MLEESVFQDCLEHWKRSDGHSSFWNDLSEKYLYKDAETLRQEFKNERKRRNIVKEDNQILYSMFQNKTDMPRVGVADIETLPAEVYTFGLFDQNIGTEQIISDICMLSWSGKFLNESVVYKDILTTTEAMEKNDERIVKSIWNFLSNCDYVVGHNWGSFDGKIINTLFLQYGLPPLKYTVIDTLLIAKANFRFTSNKLVFINKKLGIREKVSNEGFVLWKKCHQGDKSSLSKMMEYNVGDVMATEELFYKIRPYVRNLNIALFNTLGTYQCPTCGSEDLIEEGFYYTSAGKWQSLRCNDCKCVSRMKENLISKDKKKKLLVNS